MEEKEKEEEEEKKDVTPLNDIYYQ